MKTWFIASTILLGLFLFGCSENKTEQKDELQSPISEVKSEHEPATVAVASPEIEISKKDTAKASDFIFLVKNISEPNIDRSGYSVTKPEDNEKYITVQIWLKNTSSNEVSLTRDDFKLFDQNDAEFVEKTDFTEHRKKPILFEKDYEPVVLKPNQSKSGWVTFTTDISSTASKIQYNNITVKL